MATQTKKARMSEYSVDSKTQQLLSRYRSTVFACDISGDTRYVRCDFSHCSQHGTHLQGLRPSWTLNTLKNVKLLESHVGQEVHQFTKQQLLDLDFSGSEHYVKSQQILQSEKVPDGITKVLVVFNLNDPQSQFGEWISLFLKAASVAEGFKTCDFITITQNFISRVELMECVAKLGYLRSCQPQVEVVIVLSTHSSSQGQVFSCTPIAISKETGFEEFCSLHDFVQACQDVLGDATTAIHVSSCFTLKVDCSHADWPVDASWLKNKLKCLLSGSLKEVYETGSQVADLHLVLSAMLPQSDHGTCAKRLADSVRSARDKAFPDLAREMGLVLLSGDDVDNRLTNEGREDKVSHPGLVISTMGVVILVEQARGSASSTAASLATAVAANLEMRKASDVKCDYMVVPISTDRASFVDIKRNIKEKLINLSSNSSKVLFVALGSSFANPNVQFIELIDEWGNSKGPGKVYGIHFQNISAMQAYYTKSKLKSNLQVSDKDLSHRNGASGSLPRERRPIAVTGLVDNADGKPVAAFPVLLYMIHLAVGENGNRLSGKGIPSAVYANKPVGEGPSQWTLEEVYMETCHVLSGLSQDCGLCLLSVPCAKESVQRAPSKTDGDGSAGVFTHTSPGSGTSLLANIATDLQSGDAHLEAEGGSEVETSSVQQLGITTEGSAVDLINHDSTFGAKNINNHSNTWYTGKANSYDDPTQEHAKRHHGKLSSTSLDIIHGSSPLDIVENEQQDASSHDNTVNINRVTFLDTSQETERQPQLNTRHDLVPGFKQSSVDRLLTQKGSFAPLVIDSHVPSDCSVMESELPLVRGSSGKLGQGIPVFSEKQKSPRQVLETPREIVESSHSYVNVNDTEVKTDVESTKESKSKACKLTILEEKEHKSCNCKDDAGACKTKLSVSREEEKTERRYPECTSLENEKFEFETNNSIATDLHDTPQVEVILQPEPDVDTDTTSDSSLASLPSRKRSSVFTEPTCESKQRTKYTTAQSGTKYGSKKDCFPSFPRSPETFAKRRRLSSSSASSVESKWDKSEDLPLMANVDEVLVEHYILDLNVDFEEQVMRGSIVLFLKPTNRKFTKRQFQLCLDSTLVNIESVHEVAVPSDYKIQFLGGANGSNSDSILSKDFKSASEHRKYTGFEESSPLEKHLERSDPTSSDRCAGTDSKTSDPCSTRQEVFLRFLNDKSQNPLPYKGLDYSVHGWCVRIWKPGATGGEWPRCVWIKYHTSPEGQSLTWARDQDGRPCVFSPGAYINNRSLMPCQEPPVAMSTWQAAIGVPRGCTVVMSGDKVELSKHGDSSGDNQVSHHYEMRVPLPCSTLALAIGWFECRDGPDVECTDEYGKTFTIPCQVYAAPSLIDRAAIQLLECAPQFLKASCELLGSYPFSRLGLIILPRCFACMGLMSPNVAFLSQSILAEDVGMNIRVAHEITHAWFGLLIGAKDWTEEWLSEGFATYMEERVQARAEKWSDEKDRFICELRQILRYRSLSFEIGEVDENLQCLRPRKIRIPSVVSASEAIERSEREAESHVEGATPHAVVQFGQVCSRKWTQVHYLKGYFLLHYMGNLVGVKNFDRFLYEYVEHYKGQLVTSEVFFDFFLQKFPSLSQDVKNKLITEWLECPGMPKASLFSRILTAIANREEFASLSKKYGSLEDIANGKFASCDNTLVNQAVQEFQNWRKQDTTNKRNKTRRIRVRKQPQFDRLEVSEQVVMMLERLLERDSLSHTTLRQLDKCYRFAKCNAEIRHRWCELVVKHRFTPGLEEVKKFLIEDQGMGIYLFGELIISQQPKQRALAQDVFKEIGPEMDRCTYQTVVDMLEGNSD